MKKVPTDASGGGGSIEARLGDLDLKTPGGDKGEYWRSLERSLVDGGWYAAKEKDTVGKEDVCLLLRG